MTDSVEIEQLRWQVDCLSRAVLDISGDLVRAGMSEYNPEHSELITMGKWGLGLINVLGIDPNNVTDWMIEE